MRLNGLHRYSAVGLHTNIIREETVTADPSLDYLSKMIEMQGKDPETIMPQIQAKLGGKGSLKEWIKSARPGESKEGRDPASGRRIRIAVLDSIQKEPIQYKRTQLSIADAVIRDLISEGFLGYLGDVGRTILSKLHDMLSDEPEPHDIKRAESKYPVLSRLIRYAQTADGDIYTDSEFWSLVDELTGGKGDEVKKLADHIHRRQAESRENGGITVTEANISSVMKSLGLPESYIKEVMETHGLEDTDYDVGKLSGKAPAAPAATPTASKKSVSAIRRDNHEYIQSVILAAEWIMDSLKAAEDEAGAEGAIDRIASDPSIVSAGDLAPMAGDSMTGDSMAGDSMPMAGGLG